MAYPYSQFAAGGAGEGYSTPSTPREAFPQWDTIEHEQQDMQQQQQTQQTQDQQQQQQVQQQQQQQQEYVQPSDLHSPGLPGSFPQTIQLEQHPVVPSQSHDDSPVHLHPVQQPQELSLDTQVQQQQLPQPSGTTAVIRSNRRGHQQAQQQAHPYRRGSASASASGSGAPRQQHPHASQISVFQVQPAPQVQREQRVHFVHQHPMGRQTSSGGGGGGGGGGGVVASAVPSTSSARQSPMVPSPGSRVMSFSSSVSNSPVTNNPPLLGNVESLPDIAMAAWTPRLCPSRLQQYTHRHPTPPQSPHSPPLPQHQEESGTSTRTGMGMGIATATATGKTPRYIIRMDTHYDAESHLLTAVLEVPGVKREGLSVRLSTCAYNRVRQITVSGVVQPPFGFPFPGSSLSQLPISGSQMPLSSQHLTPTPTGAAGAFEIPSAPCVRERKYGLCQRVIPVPTELKLDDIEAHLEDGVLLLRFPCGAPGEEDGEDVYVR
ncbi:hypothetical protein DFP72DRAFT_1065418 [Ephemerocybe angulata]|uniref:SHSP domain-containing protein n=1 Tax=Ephemerocybe angulata TaxID=980116 RepID=A0A8H6I2J7_9AGAR|nr:hypothetical protein DFP72DRAFT_1065418 [Tulosesus angulatus]